jgi:uroporphyrin-III C-methyltransferase/precorrin-2 dehydrogenase/sirohydrochlorin ferrochelatase
MSGLRMDSQTRPERFGALARLPLFFALEGKRAVIAGGSLAAAWKAELLSAAGARVDIYTADPGAELVQLAADHPAGHIMLHGRAWTGADLPGAALAIGDCRDDEEAASFAAAARRCGVPVNVIDKPAYSDFSFGAIVNRSPLVIGISTGGAAPVFARTVRGRIEALLSKGFARWVLAAAAWRAAVQAAGLSFAGRRRFWELFTAHAVANADDEPGYHDFERFVDAAQGDTGRGATNGGLVTVIEFDSNDPGSLTLHAIRALHGADVIVFDQKIPHQILDFARREARKIRIGETQHGGELDRLVAKCKISGARVVHLKFRMPRDRVQVLSQASGRAAPLIPDDDVTAAN